VIRPGRAACLVTVSGLVQGVGFRPFVHRLATRHGLAGWVRNRAGEVEIELEGLAPGLDRFLEQLAAEAPPLARVERVTVEARAVTGQEGFAVLPSADDPGGRRPVSPDVATCPACEAELLDPGNRRYRYPFITCTDCGPRYSVIHGLPYDRERTSMAAFRQCPACEAEYRTPGDRRFHSETNACAACGPRLSCVTGAGAVAGNEASLAAAAALLAGGGILAVRGLGGFHLAVDATNPAAVDRLRRRKHRDAKPLAVMVATLDDARALAEIDAAEAAVLAGPARPIVLARRRTAAALAPGVAPGLAWVGLMLPSTPLHHLLLREAARPLIMTSGNRSEEPIATGNDEAVARLGSIADGFLRHDREILTRVDDSVVRVVRGHPVLLRRARGHAPLPIALPVAAPVPLLAVGAHLKSTFTLALGERAWVSQHLGDLENLETLEHFRTTLATCRRLFRIAPRAVARDLHPDYLSSRIARDLGLPEVAVQHHHAHVAAVLAEHGETGPALGVAFDGTGLGDDGTVWGAEVLAADLRQAVRVAGFRPAPLPGGDLAARTPWRAALGFASLAPGLDEALAPAFAGVPPAERRAAERQIATGVNCPLASSMGRLFDAAAALLGVRRTAAYEGQAAMELESLAGRRPAAEYPAAIAGRGDRLEADPTSVLAALAWRLRRGADPADLAADFHASVARTTEELVRQAAERTGLRTVALGGGSFQNARLLESLTGRLRDLGLRVLLPTRLGPNDGAVSYGQAAVAAARLAAGPG
jgi:hydrogenase maturation protein HypF